jgi:predicted ATPase
VTLTGPGGCGKTRLAPVVASESVESFEDGVWWSGLASLSDLTLVPQEVASVLNVREQPGRSFTEVLVESLKSEKVMLVIDNCEHLVGACAELADTLLRSCPRLHILATSREILGIDGEISWPVPPLSAPDPNDLPPIEELLHSEAVTLFTERAKTNAPVFELTEHNAPAVARVCQRLDGVPLAIELAAARARVLSAEQIAARLDRSFGLLKSVARGGLDGARSGGYGSGRDGRRGGYRVKRDGRDRSQPRCLFPESTGGCGETPGRLSAGDEAV